MCIYSNFATFRHRYVLSSSLNDDRIAAHSFWIISRSSAWVRAVRMVRISSRNLMGAGILWIWKRHKIEMFLCFAPKTIHTTSHIKHWLVFKNTRLAKSSLDMIMYAFTLQMYHVQIPKLNKFLQRLQSINYYRNQDRAWEHLCLSGVLVHSCNPNFREAEVGKLP